MAQPVCAIVGAGQGLGRALAERFGREGFTIALVGRRPEALASLAEALADQEIDAHPFTADAGDPTSLLDALDEVRAALAAPQVLIYNAVALRQSPPAALAFDDLMADLSVNVGGALVAAQAVIPPMRAARVGTILFTGGGFAFEPQTDLASLGVGKAALRNLTFSLAKELAADGIHVATVTIAGMIEPDSPFDPARIARIYWALYAQTPENWEREVIFRG